MSVTLGTDIATGDPVCLTTGDRMLGTYVIGITGTGKSTLILNMIVQDMAQGRGLTLLDPHGDLVDDVLARVPEKRKGDVIYLDFGDENYPPGFDLYYAPKSDSAIITSRQITSSVNAFEKLLGKESWGPRMENLLRMIALAFRDTPGATMTEIPALLTHEGFRQLVIDNLTSPVARMFWLEYEAKKGKDAYIESTMTKVNAFLTSPMLVRIVGQPGKIVDFTRAMAGQQILLAKIPAGLLGDGPTNFLGSLIVDRIITATLARASLPASGRPFYGLYVDEFQRFSSPDFPIFIAEGRKYGIGLLLAHQWRDQLDTGNKAATRSARNSLIFQVNTDDATGIARGFSSVPIERAETASPIPASPWDVLSRRGHTDPQTVTHIQFVEKDLTKLEHLARASYVQSGRPSGQLRSGLLEPVQQSLNSHLYSVLVHGGDPSDVFRWLSDLVAGLSIPTAFLRDMSLDIMFLASHLTKVGMPQAPREASRDLGQISHGLSSLPSYHAKCKLTREGRVIECTIKTNPPVVTEPGTIAQEIIRESRRRYCTEAATVDRKLAAFQRELEEETPPALFDAPPGRF